MSTIPSSVITMVTTIPKLNNSNWFTWIKKLKMVFLAAGLDGIASRSPPTDLDLKAKWDLLDRQMLAYLYISIEDDFQYLVEDENTTSAAWKKLKDYFQRSMLGA